MKNYLVTGGSGYLGSHICLLLKEKGHTVVIYDIKSPDHKYFDHFCHGDIRDAENLGMAFSYCKYDAVIHCAGRIEVGESMKNPTEFWEVNVGGTAILLNAMKKAKVKKLLFSSTAAVYAPSKKPLSEKSPLKSSSVYGNTKLACEQMIADSGLKYGIFRYFNLAGAYWLWGLGENHEPETHLIPSVLLNPDKVKIFGNDYDTVDGTCVRDYVDVRDVAQTHLDALKHLHKNPSFLVNLGSGKGYSVGQILHTIHRNVYVHITAEIAPRREGDPDTLVADISLAQKLLKYSPEYDIREMISSMFYYLQEQGRIKK
ncbi:GalE UDP-glucose 4-epimerase [uncultured Caudovirales phage]|uniref:GalE UDP-glucose 4-epimerase n=1 Tax=uncultured Caudovirales phage TaxID=2100421 RepID=A0A6J5L0A8_9CAUD|nr:GalE UDP-glucose 4-epimerase [uncultured Caudovirales phage]